MNQNLDEPRMLNEQFLNARGFFRRDMVSLGSRTSAYLSGGWTYFAKMRGDFRFEGQSRFSANGKLTMGLTMLDPIINKRLYQQVAERIRRQIETGSLVVGDRLPAEKDLAQQLGVSRPTVREALVALEIAGFVEIRTGSGTYVCSRGKLLPPMLDAGPGPFELLHARLLIEGEVASEAAIRVTAEDLAAVEATILEMEQKILAGEHSRAADQKFHVLIANISGNSVLAELVSNLWQGMFSPMFYKMSELTGLIANQELALAEHKAIFAALTTHDPVGARAAMRRHLKSVETVLAKNSVAFISGKS